MPQAGMFAPAEALSGSLYSGLFTHYKREDATMERGKRDEELDRMSAITDWIALEVTAAALSAPSSAQTRSIIRAQNEAGVRVVFITHMYDLAEGFHAGGDGRILFLHAEPEQDGRRTHRLSTAAPLPTSYGEDLYRETFAEPHEEVTA